MSKHLLIYLLSLIFGLLSFADSQTMWTKYSGNPVLDPGSSGEWDDNAILPSCVLLEDTLYRMWYFGHDGSVFRIGHATSPNETDWAKDTLNNPVLDIGQPGSWDDVRVAVPYILHHDSLYQMWYGGYDGTTTRIGYATSTNGIQWEKYDDTTTTNPPYAESDPVLVPGPPGSWYGGHVSGPCIRFDGSTYHMWFTGWDASDENASIGYATSTDGINWMLDTLNSPGLTPSAGSWDSHHVEVPRVVFDGNTYHMLYHGRNTDSWFRWRIGYATSPNETDWEKDTLNNPVLTPSAGSWDGQWVGFCDVLLDTATSQYKIWYGGGDANEDGHVGYATAIPTGIHGELSIEIPSNFVLMQNYPNPFNPSTTLKFDLAKNTNVTLKIFNILGEEVGTLVSERLAAGSHAYKWDASKMASGIYLYRLEAENFVETRKMVLMR